MNKELELVRIELPPCPCDNCPEAGHCVETCQALANWEEDRKDDD